MSAREHVRAITSKGQVTVPKVIRDRLNLGRGAMVRFTVDEEGEVTISRAAPSLEEAYGAVPPSKRPESFQALRDDAINERVSHRFGGERQ
jgi:AbrB family looped-hinge helix DNA binding protein